MNDDTTLTARKPEVRDLGFGGTPEAEVQTLNYTQLRLLAECAAGMIGAPTQFGFADGAPTAYPAEADVPTDEVLVTAADGGRYPANTVSLQVRVPGPLGLGGTKLLPLTSADAVFWSDAAVQKFLFPYVASCGGSGAAATLQTVQNAWNFYPADQVTVYALVHTVPQVGTPLALEGVIQVVYALVGGDDALQVMPLDQFVGTYPPGSLVQAAQTAFTVNYRRGQAGTPRYPDYTVLRGLAEWVCSLDRTNEYFVLRADGDGAFDGPHHDLPLFLNDGDIVVPVYNSSVPGNRPTLKGVWFQPPPPEPDQPVQGGPTNLATRYDSVFWSTGAVEQFLYPYYAGVGGLEGLLELVDIAFTWTGDVPLDLGLPEEGEPVMLAPQQETGQAGQVQVQGLVHMPTSEWTQVEGEEPESAQEVVEDAVYGVPRVIGRVSARRELHVVFTGRDGVTRTSPVERFRERHGRRRR